MNKLNITISLILISVVVGMFLFLQKDSLFNGVKPSPIPTPPDSLLFATPGKSALQDPSQAQADQALQNRQGQPPAQEPGPQAAQAVDTNEPVPASATAHIKTSKGIIDISLDGTKAPNTVKNFISKAKSGYYANLIFHRVEDWVIQGGDPKGDGTGGGQMATEINDRPFVRGSVGVARGGNIQISNDSQFFITKTDASHLNSQYTNFGDVTGGMDVVDKISIGDKILQITIENK